MSAPTLHQLAVFRVVARHLNYTRAADELHLTQPAHSLSKVGNSPNGTDG